MKYKPNMYAQALVALMMDKKADHKKLASHFLKLLEKNGDIKQAKEVSILAEKLYLKKTGARKIILESARKVDTKQVVKSFAKKLDVVEEKINPELIAGIKIIIDNEKQLDYSLKNKLEKVL